VTTSLTGRFFGTFEHTDRGSLFLKAKVLRYQELARTAFGSMGFAAIGPMNFDAEAVLVKGRQS